MYNKCYFCLDQLPKLKKESTATFFVNFGGAGVQKSRPTLLYILLSGRHPFVNNKRSSMGIGSLKKTQLKDQFPDKWIMAPNLAEKVRGNMFLSFAHPSIVSNQSFIWKKNICSRLPEVYDPATVKMPVRMVGFQVDLFKYFSEFDILFGRIKCID